MSEVSISRNHEVIVLIISNSYREGMSAEELYKVTRAAWKINPVQAKRAKYALASYRRTIKEVYRIEGWNPAPNKKDRFQFKGKVAEDNVRKCYINKRTKFRSYGVEYMLFNCD